MNARTHHHAAEQALTNHRHPAGHHHPADLSPTQDLAESVPANHPTELATAQDLAESTPTDAPRPPATGAPTSPGLGEVIGWIDDRPIPRDRLDRRITDLRNGPLRAALPVPGSSEGRQLARWLTQVILTEALCETTARALALTPLEGPPLDRLAAVELGSINAAAYNGSPWVRAVFQHVTAAAEIPPEWRPRTSPERSPGHIVRHRLFADRSSAEQATVDDLDSLGRIELDSLPAAIAEAIQRQPYGTLVGPVRDALGWHLATALPAPPLTVPTPSAGTTPSTAPSAALPSATVPSLISAEPFISPAPSFDPTSSSSPTPSSDPAPLSDRAPSSDRTRAPLFDPAPSSSLTPSSDPAASSGLTPSSDPAASSRPGSSVGPFERRTTSSAARPTPTSALRGATSSPEEDLTRPPEPAASPPHHTAATLADRDQTPSLVEAARRRAFARWLDEMRAERVKLVPGLEHPGDPRQPDNHHKH